MKSVQHDPHQREYTDEVRRLPHDTFAHPGQNLEKIDIQSGWKVADIGAGSGAYTLALARKVGEEGEVYAVDVQRELLTRIDSMAREAQLHNVHVSWGDIEEIDGIHVRDGLLDMALLSNTLFQVDEKNRLFKEIWRILKPRATLVIIDWKESFAGLGPKQKDVVSPAQAVIMLTDNGFAMKEQFDAGAHHYGIVCTKMDSTAAIPAKQVVTEGETHEEYIKRTVGQEIV